VPIILIDQKPETVYKQTRQKLISRNIIKKKPQIIEKPAPEEQLLTPEKSVNFD